MSNKIHLIGRNNLPTIKIIDKLKEKKHILYQQSIDEIINQLKRGKNV